MGHQSMKDNDALRASARAQLDRVPVDADGGRRPAWGALVAEGWLDPALDARTTCILAEEAGRSLLAEPWVETVAGSPWAAHGDAVPLGVHVGRSAFTAPPAKRAAVVDLDWVAGVRTGGAVLVPLEDGRLAVVGENNIRVQTRSSVDPTRPLVGVQIPTESCQGSGTPGDVAWLRRRYHCLLAHEAIGVGRRALEIAVDHAITRTQFGRPIGAFQAVSHALAAVYAELETASALAATTSSTLERRDGVTDPALLGAFLAAQRAALNATETAQQVLGAAGILWDSPVAALHRRACGLVHPGASAASLTAELGALVLDGGRHG